MPIDPKFGPDAQTPAARALVLMRMASAVPRLRKPLSGNEQALHLRYLEGELSWRQVRLALDAHSPA